MTYALVLSRASRGLEAPAVRVEVHLSSGLPAFTLVGMPETTVRESRDRVRSALINSHFEFPDGRVTVSLAPADLPKGGGRFDLPIALGILCASGQLPHDAVRGTECLGELALDGSLSDIRGCVAAALAATEAGRAVALPEAAAARCRVVPGSRLLCAADLLSLCAVLRGQADVSLPEPATPTDRRPAPDLAEVQGQRAARRALEIAAAGGHNLLLCGPPGTGKSLLASCLPGILPPPDASEVLVMHALQDLQSADLSAGLRPFRSPHHSASAAALVGGGSIPRPGEVSLAHGGVLFLDELAEFPRHSLDMLREPLETGEISLARAECRIRYPARFQLVAAMNPCPCGYAGDAERRCVCSSGQRRNYTARVSGPLLDRIDMQLRVEREDHFALFDESPGEASAVVRKRTRKALDRQTSRQGCANAQLSPRHLRDVLGLGSEEKALISAAIARLKLSPRATHRTLRVARTAADLAGRNTVNSADLHEALAYRQITRESVY